MKFSSLTVLGLLSSLCSVQAQSTTSMAPSMAPSLSLSPSGSPSLSLSPSGSPSLSFFPTLGSYDISFTACTFTADNVSKIGTVNCDFTASGPQGFVVNSDVYASNCSGDAPTGITHDLSDPEGESEAYTQAISIGFETFPSLTANSDPQDITFCLQAEVTDGSTVYKEIKKAINLSVTYDNSFTSDGLAVDDYDPNNADDSLDSSLEYKVTATRCDQFGTAVSGNLEIGDNFFLCVQGTPDVVMVTEIENLTAAKGESLSLLLISSGDSGGNAIQYGKGSNKLIIGIRLPASFFASEDPVTFTGDAEISVGNNRRQLLRIMQEDQTVDFSVKVGVESVSSAVSVSMFGAAIVTSAVVALVL